jgi:signal transduction histidine kinase/CheY-like chemotaxis protein
MRRFRFLDALKPPDSALERRRQAQVIRTVYGIGLLLTAAVFLLQIFSVPGSLTGPALPALLSLTAMLACLPLLLRGREHSVALLVLAASICINTFSLVREGILSPSSRVYDVLVVAAGLILGHRLVLPTAGLGLLGLLLGLTSQALGIASTPLPLHDAAVQTITAVGLLAALTTLVYFATRSIEARVAFDESIVAALPGAIRLYNFKLKRSHWLNRPPWERLEGADDVESEAAFWNAVHPEDRAVALPAWERWQSVRDGEVLLSEFRVKDAAGRWRILESRDTVYARNPDGTVKELLGYLEDVTEKHRARETLERNGRLQFLSQLAGGLAHDFNNVLAPILGHAELIRAGLSDDDPRAQAAQTVQRLVQRARELIRRILELDHKRPAHLQEVDLDQVLRGFLPLLQRSLRHDLQLDYQGPDAPAPVLADAALVERMLLNLAMNAQDVVAPGERLSVSLELTPHEAVLHFRDRGPGMTPEVRARAFEPFFTTKEPGQGTGLGLAMVHATMQQHGGSVELETEVDQGCHFRLRFPLAPRKFPAEKSAGITLGRVLVVDDEEDLRLVLRRMLEQLGWTVLEAATASSAVALAAQVGHLDLLLTDIRLPGMRGPDLAAKLRRRQPDLPCIYMSGFNDAPVDGPLLSKPFDMAELKALLEQLGVSRSN